MKILSILLPPWSVQGEDLSLSKHESISAALGKARYIIEVERGPRGRHEFRYLAESAFNLDGENGEVGKEKFDVAGKNEFEVLKGTGVKFVEVHVLDVFPLNPYGVKKYTQVFMNFGCKVHKHIAEGGYWKKSIALYGSEWTQMGVLIVARRVSGEWLKGSDGVYGVETWKQMDEAVEEVVGEMVDAIENEL